jgi:hypothetical protein
MKLMRFPPIKRKLTIKITGEEAFDDLLRFMVAHQDHVGFIRVKGSSAQYELYARAMYWAKKEDDKLRDAMNPTS